MKRELVKSLRVFLSVVQLLEKLEEIIPIEFFVFGREVLETVVPFQEIFTAQASVGEPEFYLVFG